MTIKLRDAHVGNYIAWSGNSNGYLRLCVDCGRTIYMKEDCDGIWRPYASWINGDVAQGEWKLHSCPVKR
jgi:hypothetical protein